MPLAAEWLTTIQLLKRRRRHGNQERSQSRPRPPGVMVSNALYNSARRGFLDGSIDWDSDDIRVVLLSEEYVFSQLHENLDEVLVGARVATSSALAGKTTDAGIADADDVVFPAVAGDEVVAIIIYQHTGDEFSSRLIAYIDSVALGFPLTPNGSDVRLRWSNGDSKIFRL